MISAVSSYSSSRHDRLPKQRFTTTALNAQYKTFDEMLEHHSGIPLLIDFYSPWCGPCKLMKGELAKIRPILDKMGPLIVKTDSMQDDEDCNVADAFQSSDCLEMTRGYGDTDQDKSDDEKRAEVATMRPSGISIFHVNANKFPQVGARNNIHGLPTLVLFLRGVEVWRFEGVLSGETIVQSISHELELLDSASTPETK